MLPKWLHEPGADVIFAGSMGNRAVSLFAQKGIKVFTGAPKLETETLVKSYRAKILEPGGNLRDD